MEWRIIVTDSFQKDFKKYKKNKAICDQLNKKILRLKKSPASVGAHLAGRLSGMKSTRIQRNLRLIFKVLEQKHSIALIAIGDRKYNYYNF